MPGRKAKVAKGGMRWPKYRHVIFDCDSTLTAVEGIDVLAEQAGRGEDVRRLTEAAMAGEVDLEDVYAERLRQIRPFKGDIAGLRQVYKDNAVPDAGPIIRLLQHLGHEVYVISGGLEEPVREFGISLGVPAHHIRAVGVEYDQLVGTWWSNDEDRGERYLDHAKDVLAASEGKAEIISELIGEQKGRTLLVGDGESDLLAGKTADLFVGFGGVTVRPNVREGAPVFIDSGGLAPIAPLATGPSAISRLAEPSQRALFSAGLEAIQTSVRFGDASLASRFEGALAMALMEGSL